MPQRKQHEAEHSLPKRCDMLTIQSKHKINNSGNLLQSRPKRDIKPPVRLDL